MEISISVVERFPDCPRVNWLRNIPRQALKLEGAAPETELTLVITDQEKSRQLNRAYVGEDRPTGVLSFPMMTEPSGTVFSTPPHGKKTWAR